MPQLHEPKSLLDHDELSLYTLSQKPDQLNALPEKERRQMLRQARNLRDRARTQYVKQVARTRAVTGVKRGFSGTANERSRQKAELLSQAVQALQV